MKAVFATKFRQPI